MNEDLIKHNFPTKMRRMLEKSGVSHSSFLRANQTVVLEDTVVKIQAELSKTKIRRLSVVRQIKSFVQIIDNPLWGSYVYVISSFPSDLRAKNIAVSIMAKAMDQFYKKKQTNKLLLKRTAPVWHNVMGGFRDSLLDQEGSPMPSLLVLANVTEDSTQLKVEKLRDLIVKFDGIPRIIVTTQIDPVSFMLGKVKHHCDYSLYIGPEDRDLDD